MISQRASGLLIFRLSSASLRRPLASVRRLQRAAFRSTALRSGLSRRVAFVGVLIAREALRLPAPHKKYRGCGRACEAKVFWKRAPLVPLFATGVRLT